MSCHGVLNRFVRQSGLGDGRIQRFGRPVCQNPGCSRCRRGVGQPPGGQAQGFARRYISFDHQMFAELIVRECALTAGLMERAGRPNIGAGILDSFGVEE